jgi:hypothetical protein
MSECSRTSALGLTCLSGSDSRVPWYVNHRLAFVNGYDISFDGFHRLPIPAAEIGGRGIGEAEVVVHARQTFRHLRTSRCVVIPGLPSLPPLPRLDHPPTYGPPMDPAIGLHITDLVLHVKHLPFTVAPVVEIGPVGSGIVSGPRAAPPPVPGIKGRIPTHATEASVRSFAVELSKAPRLRHIGD